MISLTIAFSCIAGILLFMYISYHSKKTSDKQLEAGDQLVQEAADAVGTMKKIHKTLQEFAGMDGGYRIHQFVTNQLQDRFYNTLTLGIRESVSADFLLNLLEGKGYTVTQHLKTAEDYNAPGVYLVFAKESLVNDEDYREKALIIGADFDEVDAQQCSTETFNISDWLVDDKLVTLSGIKLFMPQDCDELCQMDYMSDLRIAAKTATVKVERRIKVRSKTSATAYSYDSKAPGKFVVDPIRLPKEQPALNLSYPSVSNNEKRKVKLGLFLDLSLQLQLKEKFNWALFGAPNSGKSTVLRLLASKAADQGFAVVKCSASQFQEIMGDSSAKAAMLGLASHVIVIIDEASSISDEQAVALLSATEGLNDSSNLSIVLCTNSEQTMGGTHTEALLRGGRMGAVLHIDKLTPDQWRPLLAELKRVYPETSWSTPADDKASYLLGEIFALGKDPAAGDLIKQAYE